MINKTIQNLDGTLSKMSRSFQSCICTFGRIRGQRRNKVERIPGFFHHSDKNCIFNFVIIKLLFIGLGQYKPEFRGFRSYEWYNGHTGISDDGKPYGNRLIFKHYGQDILTPCPSPQSTPTGNWTIDIGGNPDVMDVCK